MRKLSIAVLLAALCASAPAFAEDKIVTSYAKSDDGGHGVAFDYDGCGGECYIGGLSCNSGGGNIEFTFGDVEPEAAASVVGSDNHAFRLAVGGASFDFNAYTLTFQEMTGTWAVTGYAASDMTPFLPALAKSKSFAAEIGKLKLELPVTADVTTWAKACAN